MDLNTNTSYQVCQDNIKIETKSDKGEFNILEGNLEGSGHTCRLIYPGALLKIDSVVYVATRFSILRFERK